MALVLAAAGLAAGGAFAQPVSPPITLFSPRTEPAAPVPSGARFYPPEALQRGVPETVILCCTARDDGGLACRVGHETLNGYGFGAHALQTMSLMRLRSDSLAAYRTFWPGKEFPLIMNFSLEGEQRLTPPTKEEQAAMCEARAIS